MAEIEFSEKELEDIEGLKGRLGQYGTPKAGEILSHVNFRRGDCRELILEALKRGGLEKFVAVDIRHESKKKPALSKRTEDREFVDPCSTC